VSGEAVTLAQIVERTNKPAERIRHVVKRMRAKNKPITWEDLM